MSSYWNDEPQVKRPWCMVCDEEIEEDRCYVLDPDYPFESCVHRKCMDRELGKMVKEIAWFVRENIENHYKDEIGLSETPTREVSGFYWED